MVNEPHVDLHVFDHRPDVGEVGLHGGDGEGLRLLLRQAAREVRVPDAVLVHPHVQHHCRGQLVPAHISPRTMVRTANSKEEKGRSKKKSPNGLRGKRTRLRSGSSQ